MIIFKTISAIRTYLEKPALQTKIVGFVPTMGALHQGHLSLIQESKQACDITVASIFVNPTQFNDPKDYEKYPVTIDQDCRLLEEAQTDILFLPSVNEMYPNGTASPKHYYLSELENLLEGRYRPGHFQGVCQVVEHLLEIVKPTQLFMGQKDYQQCIVIQQLIQTTGIQVQLNVSPTLREKGGLAMSSRNVRLTEDQRQKATTIYQQLKWIKDNYGSLDTLSLEQKATESLKNTGFAKVDYVSIADATTLQPITEHDDKKKAVALVAAFMGDVRLIDNLLLN